MMRLKVLFQKIFRKKERISSPAFFSTGTIPDNKDERDYVFSNGINQSLPSRYTWLRQYESDIKQQGKANSCTAHAAVFVWEMENRINGLKENRDFLEGSEHYVYYNGRINGGLFPKDAGVSIRDVLKAMKEKGISSERLCPYDENNINRKPTFYSDVCASLFKITEYYRITSIEDMKASILANHPVILGTKIYSNWINCEGTIPDPNNTENGGHCIVADAYDDKKGFWICNSWGINWGNRGGAWIPYKYLENIGWWDAWSIRINKDR